MFLGACVRGPSLQSAWRFFVFLKSKFSCFSPSLSLSLTFPLPFRFWTHKDKTDPRPYPLPRARPPRTPTLSLGGRDPQPARDALHGPRSATGRGSHSFAQLRARGPAARTKLRRRPPLSPRAGPGPEPSEPPAPTRRGPPGQAGLTHLRLRLRGASRDSPADGKVRARARACSGACREAPRP